MFCLIRYLPRVTNCRLKSTSIPTPSIYGWYSLRPVGQIRALDLFQPDFFVRHTSWIDPCRELFTEHKVHGVKYDR